VGGEEDPWEWGSVRSGALWRYCGTTERSGTKGRVTMLIFCSLKNKIEDEIIGKIIHLTTFTLRGKI
jgi:hypothetical protein